MVQPGYGSHSTWGQDVEYVSLPSVHHLVWLNVSTGAWDYFAYWICDAFSVRVHSKCITWFIDVFGTDRLLSGNKVVQWSRLDWTGSSPLYVCPWDFSSWASLSVLMVLSEQDFEFVCEFLSHPLSVSLEFFVFSVPSHHSVSGIQQE